MYLPHGGRGCGALSQDRRAQRRTDAPGGLPAQAEGGGRVEDGRLHPQVPRRLEAAVCLHRLDHLHHLPIELRGEEGERRPGEGAPRSDG